MKKDIENKGKSAFQFLTKGKDQVEETPHAEAEEGGEPESEDEEEEAPEVEGEESEEAPEAEEGDGLGHPTREELEAGEESEPGEEAKAPAWLELLKEGTSGGDPGKVTDKELLKIKGIGKATLEEIREIYPYQEPKRTGKVMVEVLPMRGIGGIGKEGTQAEMEWEQAEQYVQEGYVKILE